MKKLLLITLIFMLHVPVYAAESFSTLEERMSGKEFMQTGLSKLTDDELFELNEWLRRHSVATLENAAARPASAGSVTAVAAAGTAKDDRGFENKVKYNKDTGYDDTIHATIAGKFTGWTGKKTQFKLTNGMIWEQVEYGTFNIKATENPEITIKTGVAGGWRLSVVGYNSTIGVKRIK